MFINSYARLIQLKVKRIFRSIEAFFFTIPYTCRKTIHGRISLVEKDINCLYILTKDYNLVRCFVPKVDKNFQLDYLISIEGYLWKDDLGVVLDVYSGSRYIIDTNEREVINSEIFVQKF